MSQHPSSKFSSSVEADAADVFQRMMEEHRHGLSAAKQLLSRMRRQERVRDIEGLSKLERFFSLVKVSSSYLGLTQLREVASEAERVLGRLQWPSSVPTAAVLSALEESLRFAAAELSRDPRVAPTQEQREQVARLLSHLRSAEPATRSVLPDQLSDEQLFVEDASRHIQQCRAAVVQAADDATQRADAIHAAFRAMHTLKGNAGMMGLAEIEALSRAVEWALEGLREGDLALTSNLTVALLNLLDKGQGALERPRAFQWQREAEALDVACTEARYLAQRTRIGALLVEHSFVSREQVELVLAIKREPLGQALILLNALDETQLARALQLQEKLRAGEEPGALEPVAPQARGALVERGKLDRLARHATELRRLLSDAPAPVTHALRQLERSLAACSSAPLRDAFRRAAALLRELAKKQRKQVHVSLHGEELELPRPALAVVSDALVHLVRNAVDHGIEPEFERVAKAKDAVARVALTARANDDALVIEVIDDGRGLSRERLLQKAIERGLLDLSDAHTLADEEVHGLIFRPGFSTAECPNDVSGKGVGMDAVKHAIEALGGQVLLKATAGEGTRVRLTIPLEAALTPSRG